MCFKPVRPQRVRVALEFLQRANPLYYDVLICDGNINNYDLLLIKKYLHESDADFEIESDDELEPKSNPLSAQRHAVKNLLKLTTLFPKSV